ncbi:MAG TPA: TRAP transporter permease [Chloroflexota bacterium]|nr:TRAP transporter permease [Chloroflexota bacterium]
MAKEVPPQAFETVSEEEVERITAKLDVGSRLRKFVGPFGIFIIIMAAAMSIFHLYTTFFGFFDAPIQRAAFFIFVFVMGFALYPARFKGTLDTRRIPPWYDLILMGLSAMVGGYIIVNFENIVENMGNPTQLDLIMGSIACLLVLELCRRAVGPVLMFICLFFILYAFWGNYIPGFLSHRGYPFTRVVSHMYLTTEGIFGVATGVATTYVFMFILFGAFLVRTGTGQFFNDIAVALLGGYSGGPAKVAVFASALEGTINGSSVANVVGSGSFTIPLMKSIGYKPYFAGAVEAAASTGGQIMPPVMGAGAFIMSEILGRPYIEICIAAALPAVLYFTGVLVGVHLEAKRTGLEGLPRNMLPSPMKVMKERGVMLLPIVAVVWMLMNGYTPPYAAVTGIIASIVFGAMLKTTRVHPIKYWEALVAGARDALGVSIACISIGFIMGSATLTGAGLKIANSIVMLSGGNLFLTLFFTMIASLILGMGLPTTANYLVTSTIAAPAIVQAGVPLLSAHLFVFYFGIVADLTPPVALAAMAGAGLAGAPPTKTGVQAFRLAAPAYLVPYVFCYAPQMTLLGYDFISGVEASVTSVLGVIALGVGLFGWMMTWVPWWQRVSMLAAALLLITPGWETDLAGFIILAAVFMHQRYLVKSGKAKPVERTSILPGQTPGSPA